MAQNRPFTVKMIFCLLSEVFIYLFDNTCAYMPYLFSFTKNGILCVGLMHFLHLTAVAQNPLKDSTQVLEMITVQAYEYERPIQDIPVAVSVLLKKDFDRFNNTSFVPVFNAAPGVRMEERSPGSYRLSIRGSTLRSPFGVRNVKVYWNNLPLTDPGGNTYLNLVDFSMIQQAEIVKGPGASVYGAGTGGVLLLQGSTPEYNRKQIVLSTTGGSFGMRRFNLGWQNSSDKFNSTIQYAHQQADGYREQSKMIRDVFMAQGNYTPDDKRVISVNVLYADLLYQTPGALTKIQYDTFPRQARPASGPSRSAVEQKATIFNKTFYSSVSHEYTITTKWMNRTGAYGTFTRFENPAIRNFERKTEQSFGMRSVTSYSGERLKINLGGEYQNGFSPIRVYGNNGGVVGPLQTDDEITSTSALLFSQFDLSLPLEFFLTVGASVNFYEIGFHRLAPNPTKAQRNFTPVFSPRIAVLKKITNSFSVYGSFSQGFSPPTVADLYPSTAVFDQRLNPERGNNYEIGVKGNALHKTLMFEITSYDFQLKQTIVSRRDTTKNDDPEYFVNAGNTSQKGLEVNISWMPVITANSSLKDVRLWASYTLAHYRFKNYVQGLDDYSNNKVTGTPPNTFVAGVDLYLRNGFYTNITVNYVDPTPLNDANSDYAKAYTLVGGRFGFRFAHFNSLPLDIFCGVDNALNIKYSLGNDLNAVGGRFYNAAAPQNFFVGLRSNLILKKN